MQLFTRSNMLQILEFKKHARQFQDLYQVAINERTFVTWRMKFRRPDWTPFQVPVRRQRTLETNRYQVRALETKTIYCDFTDKPLLNYSLLHHNVGILGQQDVLRGQRKAHLSTNTKAAFA